MTLFSDRRSFLRAVMGGAAGLSLSYGAAGRVLAQAAAAAGTSPIMATRLTDELTLLTGAGGNVLLLNGPESVLMVDGGLPERSAELLAAVARLTGERPVQTLFNTHWHHDHTGSNAALGRAGAKIVAHANTQLWLSTDISRPWEERTFEPLPPEARPNEVVYGAGKLDLGGKPVEYGYLLQAHTDGDLYVRFPAANVIAAGGAVSGEGWPLIDWWTGGWIIGMMNGLRTLIGLSDGQTRIVPGNGPVLSRADLEAQLKMYATIAERLQKMLRQGLGPEEVVAAAPAKEFEAKMGDSEFFVTMAFKSLWGHLSPDA